MWLQNHRVNENNIIERHCTQCGEWLEENLSNFYLMNKSHPERGYTGRCRKCTTKNTLDYHFEHRDERLIYLREAYAKDPQKYIEWDRENRLADIEGHRLKDKKWRQAHPEKCCEYAKLHRNHDITRTEEEALLKVFNYQCAYCVMTLEDHKNKFGQKLHNDHVDDDGYNDLRNDVPSCMSCNTSKHQFSLEEWYPTRKFYDVNKYKKIIWWITEGYKDYIEDKPPYKITRKQNDDKRTYHFELWTVDEMRNMVKCIDIKSKKRDLNIHMIDNLKEDI